MVWKLSRIAVLRTGTEAGIQVWVGKHSIEFCNIWRDDINFTTTNCKNAFKKIVINIFDEPVQFLRYDHLQLFYILLSV